MIDELNVITKKLGEKLLEWKKTKLTEGHWEGRQFKAKADLIAHDFLESRLKKLAPDIMIISEENKASLLENRPDKYWIIDPIDGTASYVHGFAGFVTQIALIVKNQIELSSVYAPQLDELYYAQRGGGAFLNNQQLILMTKKNIESLIDNYPKPKGIAKKAMKSFHIKKYIECGSIGLKTCKVAAGVADLFLKDVLVRDWDLAPADLILKEAGGCLCDIKGNNFKYTHNYEHEGVIAASSEEIKNQVINWFKEQT